MKWTQYIHKHKYGYALYSVACIEFKSHQAKFHKIVAKLAIHSADKSLHVFFINLTNVK
jgi:hypothetical protein